ncbi:MAG: pyridoxine 5'-phosphate synthase [Pseudomonadota bacterium]
MSSHRIRLGFNVDHFATLRNARGGAHPDVVRAAKAAVAAGADGITCHLREDRRHIRDDDAPAIKAAIGDAPLNFEMAATEEMRAFALELRPHAACIVPEKREEVTTEGGLDLDADPDALGDLIRALTAAGVRVSLFIDPEPSIVAKAAALGAPVVELHTGAYCEHPGAAEFARLRAAADACAAQGVELHAGHGLDFETARTVASLPGLRELNIGHFLVGEAAFVGLAPAIARMRAAIDEGTEA